MYLLLYSFLCTVHIGVVTPHKMFFSCISASGMSYIQRYFFKRKLVKTSIHTQLKQTNLENRLHILRESPKEGFNDTVFEHFVAELKHGNSNMRMDLQLLVPVFLCLYSLCLVVMIPLTGTNLKT